LALRFSIEARDRRRHLFDGLNLLADKDGLLSGQDGGGHRAEAQFSGVPDIASRGTISGGSRVESAVLSTETAVLSAESAAGPTAGPASGSGSSACGRVGSLFSSNLFVEGVQGLSYGTVDVEPPVADKVLLLEQGAVRAEEAVLGEPTLSVIGADMEGLAVGLNISVVASINLTVAEEGSLGNLGKDGVIVSGNARNGVLEGAGAASVATTAVAGSAVTSSATEASASVTSAESTAAAAESAGAGAGSARSRSKAVGAGAEAAGAGAEAARAGAEAARAGAGAAASAGSILALTGSSAN